MILKEVSWETKFMSWGVAWIEYEIHGYLKDREKESGRWDDIVKCHGRYPLNGYEISRVFKVNFGFEDGCGFNDILCERDIDFNDLHFYSEKCRSRKCEEMILIIEICEEREGGA